METRHCFPLLYNMVYVPVVSSFLCWFFFFFLTEAHRGFLFLALQSTLHMEHPLEI